MLGLRYRVGNKEFINPYQGLYESAKTGHFSEAILPKFHTDRFLAVDVESLKQYTTQDLIKRKLQILRDSHQRIRFMYGGGVDSHTILLHALDMGIKFEEMLTYSNSIEPDPYVEYEINDVIEFANNTGMNYVLHRPTLQDYEEIWSDPLIFTKLQDFSHGFYPTYSDYFLRDRDNDYFDLVGYDKPWYYIDKNDNYYWVLQDGTDTCIGRYHEDFFSGSICPELTVKLVYRGYEFVKTQNKKGFVVYKHLPQKEYCAYLGLEEGIAINYNGSKSTEEWNATLMFNEKHRRALEQVIKKGRLDIAKAWKNTSQNIVDCLQKAPYSIETKKHYCKEMNEEVMLTVNTARITAIFQIHEDRLELLPHTDIYQIDK